MSQKVDLDALDGLRRYFLSEDLELSAEVVESAVAELREARELLALRKRVVDALTGILEIGKRDTSNQKYDGYYEEAAEALAAAREWEGKNG